MRGEQAGGVAERERGVRRVLGIDAVANAGVAGAKAAVGFAVGSSAILGDAVHSLADLSNNAMAFVALRLAGSPPDPEHPYGHRKFETLAVFVIGTLLAVLALQLALRTLSGARHPVETRGWGLALMLGVLAVNVAVTLWKGRAAERFDSDLLRADTRHTFSDVLVTIAVIASWQLAASGYAWLDPLATLLVAALILYLAWSLFRRAVPVLVDQRLLDPAEVSAALRGISGVRATRRVRSRGAAGEPRVDVVVSVDGGLTTEQSHAIADEIERVLAERFSVQDVTVHVEPERATRRNTP
jgi:cation diffusion facilitator family transporter